ncbi:hypothetical protein BB561_001349 [Smittium simulii]|uniref:Large ribosomal subunit protein uL30-like ferredoxin-like fold domain-containing protein n=1 Tax=Smittium simulii TaxID=133385 RepID=A0A2T9YV35_9FUNG|nr:hypothetical protein BB561_001349 [Smittium simulii]
MLKPQASSLKLLNLWCSATRTNFARQLSTVSTVTENTTATNPIAEQTTIQKYYKVKLIRSLIGLRPQTVKVAKAISLTSLGKTIFLRVNQENAGKILKLKELIKLEVTDNDTPDNFKPQRGYSVIKKFK